MNRSVGFVVFLGLLLVTAAVRCHESHRASGLIAGEERARRTLATLYDASIEATRDGVRHPGLRGEFLAGIPELHEIRGLGNELISYARDEEYVYGLATRTVPDPRGSAPRQGFILRAWPRDYGATGDLEFQLDDDGDLWQGQNPLGRSGTDVAFPPHFPDPDVGRPDEPWWIVPLPGHR